jgi:hypothetical protein
LNASATQVSTLTSNAFYVNPVRSSSGTTGGVLLYDNFTKEIATNSNVYYQQGYIYNNNTTDSQAGIQLKTTHPNGGFVSFFHDKTTGGVYLDVSGAFNIRRNSSYNSTAPMLSFSENGTINLSSATSLGVDSSIAVTGAIFGRNDTTANSFSGTLGYTYHPIGWTIILNKVIANLPSASTTNIITFGTANTEFSTLSNGLWLLGVNISNATGVGVCTAISTQWGIGGGGTLLNTAQFTMGVTGLFQLDGSNAILRATGNGTTSVIYNVYPTWSAQPTFTFNMYAIKLG